MEEKTKKVRNNTKTVANISEIEKGNVHFSYTKYSLNGGDFVGKIDFVADLIHEFLQKNPRVEYAKIKELFNNKLISHQWLCARVVCTEEEYDNWKNGTGDSRKEQRYCKDCLESGDGVKFYVNRMWSKEDMEGMTELAKKLGFTVTVRNKVDDKNIVTKL